MKIDSWAVFSSEFDLRNAAHYFPQTSWTLIEAIRGGGDAAAPALAELTSRYYRPAHAYITAILRDQGMLLGPDQTEELTRGFFTVTVVSGRQDGRRGAAFVVQSGRGAWPDRSGSDPPTPYCTVAPDSGFHPPLGAGPFGSRGARAAIG